MYKTLKCKRRFSFLFPQSVFMPQKIEASMRPHGTSSHTTMCCIKGVLWHGPVTPRCDSRADHQLLYLSGSKWAYLLLPSIPSAGLWRLSDGLVHLQSSRPPTPLLLWAQRHQPEPSSRQWDMPQDNICHPLVTCRVKPTTESRACSERSWFYHNKDLSATACL